MRIYNYSDQPIYYNGHAIDAIEVKLPQEQSFNFGTSTYGPTQNDEYVESYHLYGTGASLGVQWQYESHDLDNIPAFTVLFITCFFFCVFIKIVQKLKTRG